MMKTYSLIFVMLISLCGFAQDETLGRFHADVVPGGVFLSWEIIAGQTCDGIEIQRRTNNGPWLNVGGIEGVCGSITEPVPYDFIDSAPDQGSFNEYRLGLGNIGYTSPVGVLYHDFSNGDFVLLQDLEGGFVRIVPEDDFSETTIAEVVDLKGTIVDSFALYSTGPTDHNIAGLPKGVYIVRISRGPRLLFTDRFVKF